MKELEEGVFNLEWQEPFDIPLNQLKQMLCIYGNGLEQGIMSVIFGYARRYNCWVGVTTARLLSAIVSFDGDRLGIQPGELGKIQALAVDTAQRLRIALEQMVAGKCLRRIENEQHNPIYCPVVQFK